MIPRHSLANGYEISRIIKGGWHLAGDHGSVEPGQALRDMAVFVEAGITTFDCADIYTGVEALIGAFRREYPALARHVQVHTKFVPDLSDLGSLSRRQIEAGIDRSLQRLGVERLDLVQFHWWDFEVPRYVEVAAELARLRQAGKISHLGVTNFDTPHLDELIRAGIPVIAHQLQYSLIDERAAGSMAGLCARHGIALLCYGTVAGGFLSERWLGRPPPPADLANRSLIKYKLIVDDFGGWDPFQRLLRGLGEIAAKHHTDIASVASRAILDREQVAAAIIGATNTSHLGAHTALAGLHLDAADQARIAQLTAGRAGPQGDVYVLERDRTGRHGQIMKYELNSQGEG